MSISTIKTVMETKLNAEIQTTAIKWFNSSSHTLNGVVLTPSEISALTQFIEPRIIPIDEDREIIGSATGFKYLVFFQVSIYTKLNKGSGGIYTLSDTLNALFKEQIESDVVCDMTETLVSYESGDWLVTPIRFRCHIYAS